MHPRRNGHQPALFDVLASEPVLSEFESWVRSVALAHPIIGSGTRNRLSVLRRLLVEDEPPPHSLAFEERPGRQPDLLKFALAFKEAEVSESELWHYRYQRRDPLGWWSAKLWAEAIAATDEELNAECRRLKHDEAMRKALAKANKGIPMRRNYIGRAAYDPAGVFCRDGGCCTVCGNRLTMNLNEARSDREYQWCGHIVDRYLGGSDRETNLVAQCCQCNYYKPGHRSKAAYFLWVQWARRFYRSAREAWESVQGHQFCIDRDVDDVLWKRAVLAAGHWQRSRGDED